MVLSAAMLNKVEIPPKVGRLDALIQPLLPKPPILLFMSQRNAPPLN
jgi:hypothetical protein